MNNINEMLDGTLLDVSSEFHTCEKCGYEIEEEAIVVDGKLYHYNCSKIEV